jgi:Uma2 family endonuclease
MATYLKPRFYTLDEYLALERQSPIKHEYVGGRIYAMAGGTPAHNEIGANVIMHLGPRLTQRGGWRSRDPSSGPLDG